MPKNQFQRPLRVVPSHNVPRHGAPLPQRKVEAKRVSVAKGEAPVALPPLDALLGKSRQS